MKGVVALRLGLLGVVALVAAGAAGGARLAASPDEPAAYGEARLGPLRVVSGVRVTARTVDLRGMWQQTGSCAANRRLRVAGLVEFARGAAHRRVTRTGTFVAPNCSEGGPNVGFTLSARAARLACPDGRWRPGRYSFSTTTTEPTKALRAVASLVWTSTRAC